jgi:hypothetical protein
MNPEFEDIRPYNDDEINAAMLRIAANSVFDTIARKVFPSIPADVMKERITKIHDTSAFQGEIMKPIISNVLKNSSTSFSFSGLEKLDRTEAYLFISNHRDILLDAALLQIILFDSGYRTSGITFGSNLMAGEMAVDIGKANKMFKVEREGSNAEIYHHSKHLSDYIRYSITTKKESVWIAQRNGRTKDGIDKTETGVIKMFSMSGAAEFVKSFMELNIAPVSISYEYEPCDFLKTAELYQKEAFGSYTKATGEDYNSVLTGIVQQKGGIHLCFTEPVTLKELNAISQDNCKTRIAELAQIIDERINKGYKLWKTNYMAYDIINNSNTYCDKYTPDQKAAFIKYMKTQLDKIEGDMEILQKIFLGIYANPVTNR